MCGIFAIGSHHRALLSNIHRLGGEVLERPTGSSTASRDERRRWNERASAPGSKPRDSSEWKPGVEERGPHSGDEAVVNWMSVLQPCASVEGREPKAIRSTALSAHAIKGFERSTWLVRPLLPSHQSKCF